MSWTVLQCYVRSSIALSLPLCKTLHFCFCLFFTRSPYIHQRCKRVLSGLLWACAFHFLLPQHIWRPSSSYFLKRFPPLLSLQPFVSFCYFPCLLSISKVGTNYIYISGPFNRCGSLESCSSPRKARKRGQNKGQPLCWFRRELQTYQNVEPQHFKKNVHFSLLEPAICTRNTG